MNQSVAIAIGALFLTSCLVRILPAFVSFRMAPGSRRYVERVLPAAVFINFAVYIAYSELVREPLAAAVSLAVVAAVAFLNALGLISAAALGTALYFLLAS
ncbi:MAG TPA: hypothetical protein VL129_10195 [Pseudomonas sp.]|jgi:branched-subunit amino acid transport protein AzlD|uniref:hypothetical protein n=1 Tax=Pseudomonas sp. TaxID=306 RepID=UPI002BDEEB2A|nr:hypothetical protein [Pseudomonas sp.]HTN31419.1 hypothetical protein [Pseudomonas sp.]HTO19500.1 hypothetical protein [Pseudomonas sp.]